MSPADAVERTRAEQGLPPRVVDEEALAAVAAVIAPAIVDLKRTTRTVSENV